MADRVVLAPLNHLHHHHHHHHPLHTHYSTHPHHHTSSRKRKQVKRLSSNSQLLANPNAAAYYPTAFITNPCDQLFGPPQPFDYELDMSKTSANDRSFNANTSLNSDSLADTSTTSTATSLSRTTTVTARVEVNEESGRGECELTGNDVENYGDSNNDDGVVDVGDEGSGACERFDYIPTPKWTKIQNSILEELFKKSRYPKSNELKTLAQRFRVMDSDIEEWFRKRRGRDRKIKRKNEVLKNLIDCYIDK